MKILRQHFCAFKRALFQLILSPLGTLISVLAIAIALTLPAFGFLLLESATAFGQKMGLHEITLFLEKGADSKEITEKLKTLPLTFQFVDKKTAFQNLSESLHLAQIKDFLDENPLPDAFIITPATQSKEALADLQTKFLKWNGIARVQWDSAWVERFDAFLALATRLIEVLALLLSAGLIAIVFNNVRLQIMFYRDEIEVAAMMGATKSFINTPFYYFGALLGLLGALFSALILYELINYLNPAVQHLAQFYALPLLLHPVDLPVLLSLAGVAVLLGILAVYFSLAIFLRR